MNERDKHFINSINAYDQWWDTTGENAFFFVWIYGLFIIFAIGALFSVVRFIIQKEKFIALGVLAWVFGSAGVGIGLYWAIFLGDHSHGVALMGAPLWEILGGSVGIFLGTQMQRYLPWFKDMYGKQESH